MDVIWWITAALGAVSLNLIASELFAWGPRLSECLMRCAVRQLAAEMQERMREEWAGHLQSIPPGLSRIVVAAGFYLAAHEINVALRVRHSAKPEEASGDDSLTITIERSLTLEDLKDLKAFTNSHATFPECPDPWPPICERASNGKHEVPGAALYVSSRYGVQTFQGPCTRCRQWVDTGEIFDC